MSLFSVFVDAFKKASASKTPDALEHARSDGVLGPTADTDAFTQARTAPGSPGGIGDSAVGGGSAPPVASGDDSGTKAPTEPLPPEPPLNPVEGGDGPTKYPEAPFDPVKVVFPKAAAPGEGFKVEHGLVPEGLKDVDRTEATLNSGSVNPIVVSRDQALDSARVEDGVADISTGSGGVKIEDAYKVEDIYKVEGVDISVASSDPEEGGEFDPSKTNLDAGFMRRFNEIVHDRPPIAGGETPQSTESLPEEPQRRFLTVIEEGGEEAPGDGEGPHLTPGGSTPPDDSEGQPEHLVRLLRDRNQLSGEIDLRRGSDAFDVKIEEVVATPDHVPATPSPLPLPYPLAGDSGEERLSAGLPFKTDLGHKEFPGVKIHETLASGIHDGGGDDLPGGDGDGLADALARKAGKGQQDYLTVKMQDVLVTSRESGEDAHGGPATDHSKEEMNLAPRSEVHDAHDRFSNLDDHEPKSIAEIDEDDDLEPSSLLELKPVPSVTEMLPGLAGTMPDDVDLPDGLDADADDDADESEL